MEQGRRATDRKAVGLLVKLKHSDVGSFAEEFATNLSPGGMFIRSRTPQPVGTLVKFEVQIAGGVRVLRGTAVVRWVRETPNDEGPPGMGLQFDELDPVTQALIDRMLKLNKAAASAPSASPDAEALEKEMLAAGMLDRVGKRVTASRLPAIAPSVAPMARTAAPKHSPAKVAGRAQPSPPAPPDERLEESADLSALLDDLADLGAPVRQPLSPPVPLAVPPPSSGDVDIAVDDLLADSPAIALSDSEVKFEVLDEPMPDIDFEMESLSGDLPVAVGMALDDAEALMPPMAPIIQGAPLVAAPPPPVPARPAARPLQPHQVPLAQSYPAVPAPPAAPPPQATPPAPPPAAQAPVLRPGFDFDVDLGLAGPKLRSAADTT
jgi:molecular chaperone DnaK